MLLPWKRRLHPVFASASSLISIYWLKNWIELPWKESRLDCSSNSDFSYHCCPYAPTPISFVTLAAKFLSAVGWTHPIASLERVCF